jgi:hypothetical protein
VHLMGMAVCSVRRGIWPMLALLRKRVVVLIHYSDR